MRRKSTPNSEDGAADGTQYRWRSEGRTAMGNLLGLGDADFDVL